MTSQSIVAYWYFTAARCTFVSVFSCNVLYIWKLMPWDDTLTVGVVTGVQMKWLPGSMALDISQEFFQ